VEPSSTPWRILESNEPDPPAGEPGPRGGPWLPIAAAAVAVAIAGGAFLVSAWPDPVIRVDDAGRPAAGSLVHGSPALDDQATTAGEIVVEVGGAVSRPGVYRLPSGSRVADAIAAAGGFGSRVDAEGADRALNLAALVRDGDEIHVPARGEIGSLEAVGGDAQGTQAGGSLTGGLIDLNRATAEQLDTLPGIGPATAAKIIAARGERPFASVDDLGARKVLGPATLAKIQGLVTVRP
jgi:competence protein ComEA